MGFIRVKIGEKKRHVNPFFFASKGFGIRPAGDAIR